MRNKYFIFFLAVLTLTACNDDNPWEDSTNEFNKYVVKYDTASALVDITPQGCYILYDTIPDNGYIPKFGDLIELTYDLKLLDGTLVGTTSESKAQANSFHNEKLLYGTQSMILGGTGFTGIYVGMYVTDYSIMGIEEGLQMARNDASYKVIIPSTLGFGNRSVSVIPAYANLIWDVSIKKITPFDEIVSYKDSLMYQYIQDEFDGMMPADSSTDGTYLYTYETGSGIELKKGDYVKIEMDGYLTDNRMIFSFSGQNAYPLQIGYDGTPIQFQNALDSLRIGSKAKFLLPYKKTYPAGVHGIIPPYSSIIYHIKQITKLQ